MIEEAYVSFETAKLLKEKGFNIECYGYYDTTRLPEYRLEHSGSEMDSNNGPDCYISAPTQQMAMRWLREVHKIDIIVFHENLPNDCYWARVEHYMYTVSQQEPTYPTYEDAVEETIKDCLKNLI